MCAADGAGVCAADGAGVCAADGAGVCVADGAGVCVADGAGVCVADGIGVCVADGAGVFVPSGGAGGTAANRGVAGLPDELLSWQEARKYAASAANSNSSPTSRIFSHRGTRRREPPPASRAGTSGPSPSPAPRVLSSRSSYVM